MRRAAMVLALAALWAGCGDEPPPEVREGPDNAELKRMVSKAAGMSAVEFKRIVKSGQPPELGADRDQPLTRVLLSLPAGYPFAPQTVPEMVYAAKGPEPAQLAKALWPEGPYGTEGYASFIRPAHIRSITAEIRDGEVVGKVQFAAELLYGGTVSYVARRGDDGLWRVVELAMPATGIRVTRRDDGTWKPELKRRPLVGVKLPAPIGDEPAGPWFRVVLTPGAAEASDGVVPVQPVTVTVRRRPRRPGKRPEAVFQVSGVALTITDPRTLRSRLAKVHHELSADVPVNVVAEGGPAWGSAVTVIDLAGREHLSDVRLAGVSAALRPSPTACALVDTWPSAGRVVVAAGFKGGREGGPVVYWLDGRSVAADELADAVRRRLAGAGGKATVEIQADARLPWPYVAPVLEAAGGRTGPELPITGESTGPDLRRAPAPSDAE